MRCATIGGVQRDPEPVTVDDCISEQSDGAICVEHLRGANVTDPAVGQWQRVMSRQGVACDVAVIDNSFRHDVGTPSRLQRDGQQRQLRRISNQEHHTHVACTDGTGADRVTRPEKYAVSSAPRGVTLP